VPTGKAQPAPIEVGLISPSIMTVGAPITIGAPQAAISPIRAARHAAESARSRTLAGTIALGGCTAGGGNEQMCAYPLSLQAIPAISTVGTPGGPIHAGMARSIARPWLRWIGTPLVDLQPWRPRPSTSAAAP